MADGPALKEQMAAREPECVAGAAAVRIAEALASKNVLAIVTSDYRARDIHTALKGASPKAEVILFPASDALPGDTQPPTPANTGGRLAVLRRARGRSQAKSRGRIVCVTTAEAASEMLPKPATFDGLLTRFAIGGRLESQAFRSAVKDIGYFEDDRVDEPAEFAIRGRVIDIFPAGRTQPVRIELADGVIVHIREFDSVSQRGARDLPFVELGSAAWPLVLGRSSTLFDYFPDAVIALDPGANVERARFLSLAADSSQRSRARTVIAGPDLVSQAAWDGALGRRRMIGLSPGPEDMTRGFSASPDPVRAMNAEIAAALYDRDRVVIAGSEHDLRLIKKRLARKVAGGAKAVPKLERSGQGMAQPGQAARHAGGAELARSRAG